MPLRSPRILRAGGELGQQHPHSPFGKDAGRTFSSLFVPPGQQREKTEVGDIGLEDSNTANNSSTENPAVGEARGGVGFPQGVRGAGVELGRDWPEAGRGPPPREQKRIFDHKTGKMRHVEVGVFFRGAYK